MIEHRGLAGPESQADDVETIWRPSGGHVEAIYKYIAKNILHFFFAIYFLQYIFFAIYLLHIYIYIFRNSYFLQYISTYFLQYILCNTFFAIYF